MRPFSARIVTARLLRIAFFAKCAHVSMMCPDMIDDVLQSLNVNHDAALQRLVQWLSIPSVSTDPAYADDCVAAAQWAADRISACGLTAELVATDAHPIVLARSPRVDGAPTVLFYGHYDVQPPDPIDQWTTPPFEPDIRDGRIFARGAVDNKGQVSCFLESLRAWHDTRGALPLNLIVVIEGEEECGSLQLDQFIARSHDRLAADVVLISDTIMWAEGVPAITYALRGMLYLEVQLFGPDHDLHSGVYGGGVANPANELTKALGQLFDENHHVTIDGFYDDVLPISDAERRQWDALGFDEAAWAAEAGIDDVHGEAGFSTLERRWARPSCDINGLFGGYQGDGAKTIIPASAGAKLSFRLAANQDPHKIHQSVEKWLTQRTPLGCRWEVKQYGAAVPAAVPTDSAWLAAASGAVAAGCGREPVLIREGATIPVVGTFKSELGLDALMIGFGLPDDRPHSPNEKFNLSCFEMGCRTHVALLDALATVRM